MIVQQQLTQSWENSGGLAAHGALPKCPYDKTSPNLTIIRSSVMVHFVSELEAWLP